VVSASEQVVLDSSTRSAVNTAVDLALEHLIQMRAKEGGTLHKELLGGSAPSAALSQKFASFSHALPSDIARSFWSVSRRSALS